MMYEMPVIATPLHISAEATHNDRRPVLALYIDCAGRQSRMCRSEREEAIEVQQALGDSIPLLGFYSGCEIARSGQVMQSHNYTGVLCILSEALV